MISKNIIFKVSTILVLLFLSVPTWASKEVENCSFSKDSQKALTAIVNLANIIEMLPEDDIEAKIIADDFEQFLDDYFDEDGKFSICYFLWKLLPILEKLDLFFGIFIPPDDPECSLFPGFVDLFYHVPMACLCYKKPYDCTYMRIISFEYYLAHWYCGVYYLPKVILLRIYLFIEGGIV